MVKIVDDILEEEGLTRENLVIGGFSQGGALALNIALNHYENVAGILAMSTFLPIDEVKKTFEDVLDISRKRRHFSILRHSQIFQDIFRHFNIFLHFSEARNAPKVPEQRKKSSGSDFATPRNS